MQHMPSRELMSDVLARLWNRVSTMKFDSLACQGTDIVEQVAVPCLHACRDQCRESGRVLQNRACRGGGTDGGVGTE